VSVLVCAPPVGAVLAETKSTMSVVGGDDVATPLAGAAAALRRKASQKMHTEGLHPTSAQRGTGALGSETRSVEQTPIQELILRDHTVVKVSRATTTRENLQPTRKSPDSVLVGC
jgi:hypothetical protein